MRQGGKGGEQLRRPGRPAASPLEDLPVDGATATVTEPGCLVETGFARSG